MGGIVSEMRTALYKELERALEKAIEKGELKVSEPPEFTIEVPREDNHGDFACNIAMLLAKQARMAPRKIAGIILNNLAVDKELLLQVEIAGPGFINFYLKPNWAHPVIWAVEKQGKDFGRLDIGKGEKVQVEFVSANPTGLLHMGNARGAALGDSIASILDFAGYEVSREFYINDAGKQIENFGNSLEARYLQQYGHDVEVPEDGYHGEDIVETVKRFIDLDGEEILQSEPDARKDALTKYALKEKIGAIKNTLENFGVRYDVWFSEQSLHKKDAVRTTMDDLRKKGFIYESEQAQWFKATAFGDKKDEVLIRGNGLP
ncbi:MAG TPA: arginine--tRNA ligase, partial [Clostridia bacterium]|nr:arginine--tRNA ligase [Clostridia bacterium]